MKWMILLAGWFLGVMSLFTAEIVMMCIIDYAADKKRRNPTKDEWKVM